jgi:hypothetical protein
MSSRSRLSWRTAAEASAARSWIGIGAVALEVREANADAAQLYRELGFDEIDTIPDYYGEARHARRMRLVISDHLRKTLVTSSCGGARMIGATSIPQTAPTLEFKSFGGVALHSGRSHHPATRAHRNRLEGGRMVGPRNHTARTSLIALYDEG